jgi:PIN domain nuclease of toxin-antitoxin system
VLWIANGDAIDPSARSAIAGSAIHVSPISAWELATLVRKGRLALTMPTAAWFKQTIERMQASLPPLSIDVLVESCSLPGQPMSDPADRIIIATAREHALTVVTRDRAILDYADNGHVNALPC